MYAMHALVAKRDLHLAALLGRILFNKRHQAFLEPT
jgi:hypothetical protein